MLRVFGLLIVDYIPPKNEENFLSPSIFGNECAEEICQN